MNIAVHRNGRGAMRMIKLTKAHEIVPVLWVHSDDDGSDYRVVGINEYFGGLCPPVQRFHRV